MERHMRRCMPGHQMSLKCDELTTSLVNDRAKDLMDPQAFSRFHANKLPADSPLPSQLAANRQLGKFIFI